MQDEKALCGIADTSTGYISEPKIYNLQTETLKPIAKGLFHQFNIFTDPIQGKVYAFKGDVNNELTLMVLDISTGKVEHEYKFEDSMWEVKPLRANPREPYFGLSRKDGNGITIAEWFPENNHVVSKLNIDNKYQPGAFSLSPNGGQMVIAASEGIKELESNYDLLFMYDIETNTLSKIIMPPEYSFPLALFGKNSWSPDGKKLALDISVDFYDPNHIQKSLLCIIDTSSLKYTCRDKSGIVALAWSPDSNYVATLTGSRMLNVINLEGNEDYDLGKIEFPDIPFIDIQWTP
jgi:WD40 repeat protein